MPSSKREKDKSHKSREKHSRRDEDRRSRSATPEDDSTADNDRGNMLSLSVEETNKLREKIGLKPLNNHDTAPDALKFQEGGSRNPMLVKGSNTMSAEAESKLREKLDVRKEKRKLDAKLSTVKLLGASDSDDESAVNWVKKSKKLELEKMKAKEKQLELDEMDQYLETSYSSTDLSGLKVQHSVDQFEEGRTMILTLADKNILDKDQDDMLINVDLEVQEKANKNIRLRRGDDQYKAWDEPGLDEEGLFKPKSLLGKYDEEIDGEQKKHFVLTSGGTYAGTDEKVMKQMVADIRNKTVSLALPTVRPALEYLTADEIKFKKATKKIRRAKKSDVGAAEAKEAKTEASAADLKAETTTQPAADSTASQVERRAETLVDAEDDGAELQSALSKARRLRQRQQANTIESVVQRIKQEPDELKPSGNALVLTTLDEFCRSLVEPSGVAMETEQQPDSDEDELRQFEEQLIRERRRQEAVEAGVEQSDEEMPEERAEEQVEDVRAIMSDEPVMNNGVSSALLLAVQKGYLEKKNTVVQMDKMKHLQAQAYSIEAKRYDDLDAKANRRDRYAGPIVEFKEKDGYKPDVKLEYADNRGRLLNEKEAFRVLSHRFHGKGPGRNKLEKRLVKDAENRSLLNMTSTDTPLNTVHRMQQKMKAESTPYLLLSGKATATVGKK